MKKALLSLGLVLLGSTAIAADKKPDSEDSITVKIVGTLRGGIVAIGGETTGTTITAKNISWEVDFGRNAALKKAAENLDGKKVVLEGRLERRPGVEIKERWIVHAAKLAAAGGENQNAELDAVGPNRSDVQFRAEDGKIFIDVQSQSGIGNIEIHRRGETWPNTILVCLHLKGLESYKARNQDVAVEWSVASGGNHASRVTLWKGKQESPLANDNPYYTKVRLIGDDKSIPLKNGHFEVPLPAKLLAGNPPMIELSWIDFYRR